MVEQTKECLWWLSGNVKLIDRVKDMSCNTTVFDSRSSHVSLSARFRAWEVRIWEGGDGRTFIWRRCGHLSASHSNDSSSFGKKKPAMTMDCRRFEFDLRAVQSRSGHLSVISAF